MGNLYHSDDKHSTKYDSEQMKSIPFFTLFELQEGLQSMKNNKAADARSIIMEMIKYENRDLHEYLLEYFNSLLHDGVIDES